ncbi:MAG: hypothetical protein ACT4OU_05500 [Hyphomicrobium sp.]
MAVASFQFACGSQTAQQMLRRPSGKLAMATLYIFFSAAAAQATPPIRTSATNIVPACVTPDRLMGFLAARNPDFAPRFVGIAELYKSWGEAWRVRWDYAFFQMALETNYLSYRRGNGRPGDVQETQNNFAGIGATGRGTRGDRFVDVSTGVHAQIQHLVVYSGERLARPIAPRTVAKQDDIVEQSRRLNRAVTFGDLARRWAADRNYARSIDVIADQYRSANCEDEAASAGAVRATPTHDRAFPAPSGLGGPKPSSLAGPQSEATDGPLEILPWSTEQAQRPQEPANARERDAPPRAAQQRAAGSGPVRTVWTRKTSKPADGVQAPPITQTSSTEPAAKTQLETTASSPKGAGHDSDGAVLPLFRIAPARYD